MRFAKLKKELSDQDLVFAPETFEKIRKSQVPLTRIAWQEFNALIQEGREMFLDGRCPEVEYQCEICHMTFEDFD